MSVLELVFRSHSVSMLLILCYKALYCSPMSDFISAHVCLQNGKIYISENVKHIKIDIGLSYSAPMSQYWLTHEENLLVFGFEPNPMSINTIRNGARKRNLTDGEPLDSKYVGTNFHLIPCALGLPDTSQNSTLFYITKLDCGCSSIYPPKDFEVERTIQVPIFRLSDFFELFPFETHPIIDFVKIDTQGSDLNIAKSGGSYLENHVVYVTLEAENNAYQNTANSEEEINTYMQSIGFIRVRSENTDDPTFINLRFLDYARGHKIIIYQKG